MTDPAHSDDPRHSIALESMPVPALGYSLVDAAVRIEYVNQAFIDRFEDVEGSLSTWWQRYHVDADDTTFAELMATIRQGASLSVDLREHPRTAADRTGHRPRRCRVHVVDAEESATDGYLLFTDRSNDRSSATNWIASVVSHDLRNPLDVADARLQAARETGDDEHFEHLEQAHDRMERIIEDVLTLARGDSVVTTSESVDLEAVVRDAWATVNTAEATLSVVDDLPTIEADADRLQRLFENLFRNSIEHGCTDNIDTIAIRVGMIDDGFYVADTGQGIPADQRDSVFEPGYTRTDAGTGFGLTIVDRIACAHGWTASLTDNSAGGARFEFSNVTYSLS